MAYARAEDIRITFEWVRNWIIALAVVVAIGGGVFAYVDNAPDEEGSPAMSQRPVAATMYLDASGREKMEPLLGSKCKLRQVPVEVLASSEDSWEVVSIPSEGCQSARLKVEPEDGELQAIETVDGLEPPPAG